MKKVGEYTQIRIIGKTKQQKEAEMPNRREHDNIASIIGRLVTDRVFARQFMQKPSETVLRAGYQLSRKELDNLTKLTQADIQKIRTKIGIP